MKIEKVYCSGASAKKSRQRLGYEIVPKHVAVCMEDRPDSQTNLRHPRRFEDEARNECSREVGGKKRSVSLRRKSRQVIFYVETYWL